MGLTLIDLTGVVAVKRLEVFNKSEGSALQDSRSISEERQTRETIDSSNHLFIVHINSSSFIEFDLALTDIRIHIEPPLRINRYPLPRLLDLLPVQLRIHDLLPLPGLAHDARVRIHHHAVAPRVITRLHVPRGTAQADVNLVVDRARPRLQLPVQGARRQVEGAGVQEEEAAPAGGDGGEFGEADIVADGEGDFAVGGQVDQGQFVAGGEDVGFAEGDFAGYVDVEEVDLAVRGEEVSLGREEQGRVVVFLGGLDVFGDAAAEQVAFALDGELGEGVEAGGLLPGRRGGLEGLGVGGEVLAAVGGVEAFGEDDQGGAGFGGFEDA